MHVNVGHLHRYSQELLASTSIASQCLGIRTHSNPRVNNVVRASGPRAFTDILE